MRVWLMVVACSGCSQTVVDVGVSTDVPCSSLSSVVVVAMNAGDPSSAQTEILSNECSGSSAGQATFDPSASWQNVEITVSATIDGSDPSACTSSTPKGGCIVARRQLGQPSGHIIVPIALDAVCVGLVCTPEQTCASGACVSTH